MVFVVIKIITQELEIESNLKQRLEFICEFCHIKPTIINGSIRKIDKFIQQVDSTNKEYKKMQKLSITLNDVETELKENREKVKILTENNYALNIKVKSLEKKIDKQEDEIDDLKEKNSKLQSTINFFENLFDRLVKFIKDKMFGKEKEREDYWNFSKGLYTHNIFSDKTIQSIQNDYIWTKENDKNKKKKKMIIK